MDIISTIPQDINERILCILPIRDAVRTSILSRKWRYCWATIPELKFDHRMSEEGSSDNSQIMKHKLAKSILHVLLLHTGPLVKFTLNIELEMVPEIDQIILHLSRSNKLKHFTLLNHKDDIYKLSSTFFSLQELEHLFLSYCSVEPPLTFNGFSKLRNLFFYNVEITPEMLKLVLANCPLLMRLLLLGCPQNILSGNKRTGVELFKCSPSLVGLLISKYYMQCFARDGIPKKLPIPLVCLKFLFLSMCFMEQNEISLIFCLINSSPNLTKIYLTLHIPLPTSKNFIHIQRCTDFKLDHLDELEMVNFSNLAIEMEFVKLVLAKSPMLKKVRIEFNAKISVDEELRIHQDLTELPVASPSAKVIIERPSLLREGFYFGDAT